MTNTLPTTHRTRIKVCGNTNLDDALAAADAGADAIGFIFVEATPRYIAPDQAVNIMVSLPPFVTAVGVTRDLSVDQFCDLEQLCPTPLTQLHGKESEQTVRQCGPGIIKAFKYDHATIDSQLKRWSSLDEVDALLIDGGDGGEGKAFDWHELADRLEGFAKPVILAGGLNPDNVADAIAAVRPFAVDVSSGLEESPGKKDHAMIRDFCAAVRSADT